MTPEEARVRLRAAADRLTSANPIRRHPWRFAAGALAVGVALGSVPVLRRSAMRMIGAGARAVIGRNGTRHS